MSKGKLHADRLFGKFYFGEDVEELTNNNLREATIIERNGMLRVGMQIMPEEKVFISDDFVEFLTPDWSPTIIVRDGHVFNISLQRMDRRKNIIDMTYKDVVNWFTRDLGFPTKLSGAKHIWDTENIRILVNKRSSFLGFGNHVVNMVATCFDLSELIPFDELK